MSAEDSVIIEESGAVAHVRLNRPAKMNALTGAMLDRLRGLFDDLPGRRGGLRAVILTGGGAEAFCAGTDIGELAALDEDGALRAARRGQGVCDAIETCGVPVIAAVNGVASGGGCELALACHLRIAAAHARFELPETKLGLMPAYGGTQRLARIVGEGRANALMLAGESMSADEAWRVGLVNRVVESSELTSAAESLALSIAENAPLAVRACLEAVTRGQRMEFEEALKSEAESFSRLFATEDVREGTRAFLEKRAPVFKGR